MCVCSRRKFRLRHTCCPVLFLTNANSTFYCRRVLNPSCRRSFKMSHSAKWPCICSIVGTKPVPLVGLLLGCFCNWRISLSLSLKLNNVHALALTSSTRRRSALSSSTAPQLMYFTSYYRHSLRFFSRSLSVYPRILSASIYCFLACCS